MANNLRAVLILLLLPATLSIYTLQLNRREKLPCIITRIPKNPVSVQYGYTELTSDVNFWCSDPRHLRYLRFFAQILEIDITRVNLQITYLESYGSWIPVSKSKDSRFYVEIFDDSREIILEKTSLTSINRMISGNKLNGNYIHVCVTNQGGPKVIQIFVTPDAEKIENKLKEKEEKMNEKEIEIHKEFSSLVTKLDHYKTMMKLNDFKFISTIDTSSISHKIVKTSIISLLLVPSMFFFMFLWIKYIVNSLEKRD
ncbi:MAG: hypothetical protein MHPSP_002616, partial [Paramarteilia canceri]